MTMARDTRDGPADGRFTVACVQLCGGRDIDANIAAVSALIRQAARDGADLICTPEQSALMEINSKRLFAETARQQDDRALKALRALAAELERWVLIGSLGVKVAADKLANRSFLIGPDGSVRVTYDKIHMFDVDLGNGEVYRESKNYRPGAQAECADLPWGRLGLTICYDLRFPQLYRSLAAAGADFIAVPSAFTAETGKAHWHALARARAIETGCFIFAPAQGGTHENGRETFGHSLIVSPWGGIIAEADTGPGVISAEIDPTQVHAARAKLPTLSHDRSFAEAFGRDGVRAS